MKHISKETRNKIYNNFETQDILDAVGKVDNIRGHFNDRDVIKPPQIREDFIKLHDLFFNGGYGCKDSPELWDFVYDLSDQICDIQENLDYMAKVISDLEGLAPDPDAEEEQIKIENMEK
jgi:hypothetical protein